MMNNFIGELAVMNTLNIKPNYAELGRKYEMDPRTIKKYHEGYKGKPATRSKGSRLDTYKAEIADKLTIHRITVKGVYRFFVEQYGISLIGTYTNFNKYIKKNSLKKKDKVEGHPRFERGPGEQAQVDWKEDISLTSRHGEVFVINLLHVTLKFSDFSYLYLSVNKRFDDVARGLIKAFTAFGGIPHELLFDNMTTVANINAKPKRPTEAISRMSKDFGFSTKLCKVKGPQTKGTVEARNKILDSIRAYNGEFETLEELFNKTEKLNNEMNITISQGTNMSPTALLYKEKEYLIPLPNKEIIDSYQILKKYTVSNESLIRYNSNRYSVDPELLVRKSQQKS